MRVKMELHTDVVWFLRQRCTDDERDEFYRQLEMLRAGPIGNSEPIPVPKLREYMLRFFRFAGSIAIFEFDAAKNRVRVLECRRARPTRPGGSNRGDTGVPS